MESSIWGEQRCLPEVPETNGEILALAMCLQTRARCTVDPYFRNGQRITGAKGAGAGFTESEGLLRNRVDCEMVKMTSTANLNAKYVR